MSAPSSIQKASIAPGLDLSVVILTGGADRILLERAIRTAIHACKRATPHWELIVVDNASEWHAAAWVTELFPQVNVLRFPIRVGFCTGNNAGFRLSRGEYIVQLNDDTEADPDSFRRVLEFLATHPGAAAAGPRLVNPDGTLQVGYYARTLPTLPDVFTHLIGINRLWPSNPWLRRHLLLDEPDLSREVEQPAGAALVYRRDVLFSLGLLDEDYTFAFDDVDICRRMGHAGWKIYYVKEARVVHHGAVTFARVTSGLSEYTINGILCYFAKHERAVRFAIVRIILLSALLFRMAAVIVSVLTPWKVAGSIPLYAREFVRVLVSFFVGHTASRLPSCEAQVVQIASAERKVRHG